MSISSIVAGKAFVLLELKDKTKQQLAKFQQDLMKAGDGMMAGGAGAAVAAGAIIAPFAAALPTFRQFDDSMRMVEARSEGTKEEMAALRKQAIDLGASMSYTASEVAALQNILVTKGFDRKQVKDMTKSILEFGRAAGTGGAEDLTIAADLTANALHAFNLNATDSKRVADVMTEAMNKSALSLGSLQEAFKYVAPVAHLAGMSVEETVAAIGQLGNVGIEGSTAGTTLRQMLTRLAHKDKAEAFSKSIKEMTGQTIGFADAAGNLKPIPTILNDIGKAIQHLPSATKLDTIRRLFGLEAMTGSITLAEGANPFGDLLGQLKTASQRNVASNTAGFMESGIGGSFRQAEGALESLQIQLGEVVDGPLAALLKWSTQMLEVGAALVTQNEKSLESVTAGVGALGAMGVAVFGLGAALKYIPTILTTVTTALGGIPGVILAALGGLVVYLYTTNDAFRAVVNDGLSLLLTALSGLATLLSPLTYIVGALWYGFQKLWNGLVNFLAWLSSWSEYFQGKETLNKFTPWAGDMKPGEGDEQRISNVMEKAAALAEKVRTTFEAGAGVDANGAFRKAIEVSGDKQEAAATKNLEAANKQLAAADTALHVSDAANDPEGWQQRLRMAGADEQKQMLADAQADRLRRNKELMDKRAGLLNPQQAPPALNPQADRDAKEAAKEMADAQAKAIKAQRMPPALIQDLEEGTVAALEKFYENQAAGEEAKLQAEANKILERIEKGVKDIPGVNAKG